MTAVTTTRTTVRLVMMDWRLFAVKSLSVFVLASALVPLIAMKSELPALAYAVGLVALHVFILGVYFYRVRFRDLDPDRRSLVARVVGLLLTTYILIVASEFDPESSLATLSLQMLAVSLVHMVMLVLLMVRIEVARTAQPPA